jgi:hypothetical protein
MTTTGQQGVPQAEPEELLPLAELVTDDDVRAAWLAVCEAGMHAALEAYGRRLLGRVGQAGP